MRLRHITLLTLSLLLTGCSLFIHDPEVTVREVNLTNLDSGGVTIEFQLAVRNPNSYDVKLRGYSYDLNVSAIPVAEGGAREPLNFPGNTVTDVRIPVRIGYDSLAELLKRRPDPDNVPYRLSAGFDLETPFSTVSVPVEKNGTFAIPKQYRPDYYLRKLSDFINRMN